MIIEDLQRMDDDRLTVDLQKLLRKSASHADAASACKDNGDIPAHDICSPLH